MALSPRQHAFVQAVLKGCAKAEAARRAGYSERGASVQATRLLANAEICSAIAAGQKRAEAKTGVTQQRILDELAKLAFSDLRGMYDAQGQLLPPSQWSDEVAAAVAGAETVEMPGDAGGKLKRVKRWDKVRALELLMRNQGMLVEKVEHSVSDSLEALIVGAHKAKAEGAK